MGTRRVGKPRSFAGSIVNKNFAIDPFPRVVYVYPQRSDKSIPRLREPQSRLPVSIVIGRNPSAQHPDRMRYGRVADSYLRSARRVAESMRKFGGAQEAAERIERFAGVRN
jgi:hypothetical protein